MNIALKYNQIVAVLIFFYLLLPTANFFQHSAAAHGGLAVLQEMCSLPADSAGGDNCPNSSEHDSECCHSACCSCACHVPLANVAICSYSPMILSHPFPEPSWTLLQVFRPIFVPPQNRA